MKKTLLSAVQPSSQLTLGNYLGALKGWVEMQTEYRCLFFAVDLHAITVRQDPEKLKEQTYYALAAYIAAGINPEEAILFVQSHVPQHAELGWILTCFSSMGELSRMTQFKDKSAKLADNEGIGVGLFAYPILMAADILLYGTDVVPVGDDQMQHLQLTRTLAERVNHYVGGELFKVPTGIVPKVGARVMSLQNPTAKMSKSDPDPNGSIFLTDSDEAIVRKFKKAVTDSGEEVTYDDTKPGVQNLLEIHAAVTSQSIETVVASFAGKRYGHLKTETADAVVAKLGPIREEIERVMKDRQSLNQIIDEGTMRAKLIAADKLQHVQSVLGFIPRW